MKYTYIATVLSLSLSGTPECYDYCLIIVVVETTRLYIYHFTSSVSNCFVCLPLVSCEPNVASFCGLSRDTMT
jgi:hypothetical protein